MLVVVLFFASLIGLMRTILIILGVLKEPVLRTFEAYGPEEKVYLPLLPLLAWSGIFAMTLGFWGSAYVKFSFPTFGLGFLLMVATGLGYQNYDQMAEWHHKWLKFPRWFYELRERSTRYERRRIAYMWLTLPRRMRLAYSSDDRMFCQWADFIIMATIRDEVDNPEHSTREEVSFPNMWTS
jgi:hypothetical protein